MSLAMEVLWNDFEPKQSLELSIGFDFLRMIKKVQGESNVSEREWDLLIPYLKHINLKSIALMGI